MLLRIGCCVGLQEGKVWKDSDYTFYLSGALLAAVLGKAPDSADSSACGVCYFVCFPVLLLEVNVSLLISFCPVPFSGQFPDLSLGSEQTSNILIPGVVTWFFQEHLSLCELQLSLAWLAKYTEFNIKLTM